MKNCLFCQIIQGEISAQVVREDNKTLAILDVNPSAPGHTMVIPKEHYRDFMDLPMGEAADLFGSVQKIVEMLKLALGSEHFTIGVNSGKILGRHVDHLHVHVIPRFPGDGGDYIQGVVSNPPKE